MTPLERLRKCIELVDELEENLSELRMMSLFDEEIDNLRGGLENRLKVAELEAKRKSAVMVVEK
jgi:hypothetical protein